MNIYIYIYGIANVRESTFTLNLVLVGFVFVGESSLLQCTLPLINVIVIAVQF